MPAFVRGETMPRRSAASLAVVAQAAPSKRLKPRSGLPPEVKLIWESLVASMPDEHFRATDAPLVEQYAQAIALARQAYANLNEEGPVVAGRANPWLVVLEKAHRSSVALSMRLRLSPQSRMDRKSVKETTRSAYELMRMNEYEGE
jgi:phage terminase small subunit